MARTLSVTLHLTIEPLTNEELETATEGWIAEDEYRPKGDDSDLEDMSAGEVADLIVYTIEASQDEMWAGSNLFAKVADIDIVAADFA